MIKIADIYEVIEELREASAPFRNSKEATTIGSWFNEKMAYDALNDRDKNEKTRKMLFTRMKIVMKAGFLQKYENYKEFVSEYKKEMVKKDE